MDESEHAQLQRESAEAEAEDAAFFDETTPMTREDWMAQARQLELDLHDFPDERGDILCEAAHAWLQAGDTERAEECYQQAADTEPEPGMPDPRVPYASFLLEQGDAARGQELFTAIWRDRPAEPGTYHLAAETHEHLGHYETALTWVNAGLSRCYPPPFTPDVDEVVRDGQLNMLLMTRFRIRQALEQPDDELDTLAQQARTAFRGLLDAEHDEQPAHSAPAVPYWPAGEFDQARDAGLLPAVATDSDDPHTEHRRDAELRLRTTSSSGTTPVVVACDLAGFRAFCHENAITEPGRASVIRYAQEAARLGRSTAWPPGRNDPCWCGSQRKYKKCCGRPGFVDGAAADRD